MRIICNDCSGCEPYEGMRVRSILFNDFQPSGEIVKCLPTSGLLLIQWDDIEKNGAVRGKMKHEPLRLVEPEDGGKVSECMRFKQRESV